MGLDPGTLKDRLANSEWIICEILPHVRNAIAVRLGIELQEAPQTSVTYLTSSYYKKAPAPLPTKCLNNAQMVFSEDPHAVFWESALASDVGRGTLADSSNLVRQYQGYLRDFSSISNQTHMLANFVEYVSFVVQGNYYGASHPHYLGTLFLGARDQHDFIDFAVSMVHECAHQELFLLNFVDRLVSEGWDHSQVHAPYQEKSRPTIGRLHSAHALYRMVQLLSVVEPSGQRHRKFSKILRQNRDAFLPGELTPLGSILIEEVYANVC